MLLDVALTDVEDDADVGGDGDEEDDEDEGALEGLGDVEDMAGAGACREWVSQQHISHYTLHTTRITPHTPHSILHTSH